MKNSKMLQIVIGMLLLVIIIFIIYALFFNKSLSLNSRDSSIVKFDTITTNVEGGDYNYLKMDLSIKAQSKAQAKRIEENRPQIRRLLLYISSAQDGKSLLKEINKQNLKNQIKNNIKKDFNIVVEDIYFTNFVMADWVYYADAYTIFRSLFR